MISRRNIRVKVMQTLYVLDTREGPVPPAEAVKLLKKQFDLSTELFVFLVHILSEVTRYAETDSRNRASKHLPSTEDLNVNTRIAGNELLWIILEQPSYKAAASLFKPNLRIDNELVKKLYNELAETEQYKGYVGLNGREKKSEKEILEFIFNDIILPSEMFESHIEELFNNWDDDVDMMHQMMQHFLQKPASMNFQDMLGTDKWEFAKGLLETVLEKKEVAMDMINDRRPTSTTGRSRCDRSRTRCGHRRTRRPRPPRRCRRASGCRGSQRTPRPRPRASRSAPRGGTRRATPR